MNSARECGLHSYGPRYGSVMGLCECYFEKSDLVKRGKILEK
jgi:hypothetical protein